MRRGCVMSFLCCVQRPDDEVLYHVLVVVFHKDAR